MAGAVWTTERTSGPQVPADVRPAARSLSLWGPLHVLAGVAGALVAVMVYKPGWAVAAALLVAAYVGAWATGVVVARLHPPPDIA